MFPGCCKLSQALMTFSRFYWLCFNDSQTEVYLTYSNTINKQGDHSHGIEFRRENLYKCLIGLASNWYYVWCRNLFCCDWLANGCIYGFQKNKRLTMISWINQNLTIILCVHTGLDKSQAPLQIEIAPWHLGFCQWPGSVGSWPGRWRWAQSTVWERD